MVAAVAGRVLADRDAVPDGEFLRSDEDVLDDGAQDALAILCGGGGRAGAEPREEALEVVGQLEVGLTRGRLQGRFGAIGYPVRRAGRQESGEPAAAT